MLSSTSSRRRPLAFIGLVVACSMPFYLLGAVIDRDLPFNLPIGALMFVAPTLAASILVYRDEGMPAVRQLLRRPADVRRIGSTRWLIPTVLLLPAIYLASWWVMRLTDRSLPDPDIPIVLVPLVIAIFFVAAAAEEIGWSGYALDPAQARWGALGAGLILGLAWAAVHVVPDLQGGRSLSWIASHRSMTIVLRVLIVWIYANTGRSVFAASLFHAMDNTGSSLFPNEGSHYDPAVTAPIAALVAAAVTWLWGPATLARFRFGKGSQATMSGADEAVPRV